MDKTKLTDLMWYDSSLAIVSRKIRLAIPTHVMPNGGQKTADVTYPAPQGLHEVIVHDSGLYLFLVDPI